MELTTKRDARAAGLKHYFTGCACPRGHVSLRFVSTGGCVECLREKKAENAERHAPAKRAYSHRYRAENRDQVRAAGRAHYHANRDTYLTRSSAWHEANKDRASELRLEFVARNPGYFKGYREEHRVERAADGSKRRAARRQAVPAWFGELDELVLLEAFDVASRRERVTGFEWHVDHMVPLQAKQACGLHCASNMQVIPASVNLSKGNKMKLTEAGQWVRLT